MHIRQKRYAILLLIILGIAIWLSPFYNLSVKAAGTNPTITLANVTNTELNNIKKAVNDINTQINNDDSIGTTKNYKFVSINKADKDNNYDFELDMTTYENWSAEEKQLVMEYALNGIKDSGISKINRTKLYNFVSDSDETTSNMVRQLSTSVKGDFASAYASFKPFSGVVGWVLGIFTLFIFGALGLTLVIDIAYLVIPIVQEVLSKSKPSEKPMWVSTEAWTAVKEAEKGEAVKTPMGVYFKLKTKQFLALGICLLYLVSGQIFGLIANIMDLFSGLLGE